MFSTASGRKWGISPIETDRDTVWSEWEHRGTRLDGSQHLMRGVIIFGVDHDVIAWARFYLEPVREGSGDVDTFREGQLGVRGPS